MWYVWGMAAAEQRREDEKMRSQFGSTVEGPSSRPWHLLAFILGVRFPWPLGEIAVATGHF